MITPVTVILSFALFLLALAVFKPQAGRIVFGIFFLLMAWGVNFPIMLTNPMSFVTTGEHAYIPFYRWFFTTVLAWNPLPFIVLLIGLETSIGVLSLSKGRWAQLGLGMGAFFCLAIAWVCKEALLMPTVAVAPLLLMRKEFPASLVEMIGTLWPMRNYAK